MISTRQFTRPQGPNGPGKHFGNWWMVSGAVSLPLISQSSDSGWGPYEGDSFAKSKMVNFSLIID